VKHEGKKRLLLALRLKELEDYQVQLRENRRQKMLNMGYAEQKVDNDLNNAECVLDDRLVGSPGTNVGFILGHYPPSTPNVPIDHRGPMRPSHSCWAMNELAIVGHLIGAYLSDHVGFGDAIPISEGALSEAKDYRSRAGSAEGTQAQIDLIANQLYILAVKRAQNGKDTHFQILTFGEQCNKHHVKSLEKALERCHLKVSVISEKCAHVMQAYTKGRMFTVLQATLLDEAATEMRRLITSLHPAPPCTVYQDIQMKKTNSPGHELCMQLLSETCYGGSRQSEDQGIGRENAGGGGSEQKEGSKEAFGKSGGGGSEQKEESKEAFGKSGGGGSEQTENSKEAFGKSGGGGRGQTEGSKEAFGKSGGGGREQKEKNKESFQRKGLGGRDVSEAQLQAQQDYSFSGPLTKLKRREQFLTRMASQQHAIRVQSQARREEIIRALVHSGVFRTSTISQHNVQNVGPMVSGVVVAKWGTHHQNIAKRMQSTRVLHASTQKIMILKMMIQMMKLIRSTSSLALAVSHPRRHLLPFLPLPTRRG